MEYIDIIPGKLSLHTIDFMAFAWFAFAWLGYEEFTNRYSEGNTTSLLMLMHRYRLEWMRQVMRRDNRITDMTCLGNLTRSVSFFASTSILIALGALSLFSYREKIQEMVESIPFAAISSPVMWDIKVFVLALIFVHAFFKFTWSLRQYNYVMVYIMAAPMSYEHVETHAEYAERGAKMLTNASRHFNLGLRAFYYGFALISWFFHAYAFIFTTLIVVGVLYRREFHSNTYHALASK